MLIVTDTHPHFTSSQRSSTVTRFFLALITNVKKLNFYWEASVARQNLNTIRKEKEKIGQTKKSQNFF